MGLSSFVLHLKYYLVTQALLPHYLQRQGDWWAGGPFKQSLLTVWGGQTLELFLSYRRVAGLVTHGLDMPKLLIVQFFTTF